AAEHLAQELPLDGRQWVAARDRVRGPKRAEHEEWRRLAVVREGREQIERRMIAPVDVLEEEDERILSRDRRERRRQHLQWGLVGRGAGGGQEVDSARRRGTDGVENPRGSASAQDLVDRSAVGAAAKLCDRLQYGLVRLTAAILLEALAACETER